MKSKINILLAVCSTLSGAAAFPLKMTTNKQKTTVAVNALKLSSEQSKQMHVDGFLSESVWQVVHPATGLRQQEPVEGAAATEGTEVRILFDSHALYVGVMAFDSQPDKIISRILQRDKLMQIGTDGRPEFTGDDACCYFAGFFSRSTQCCGFCHKRKRRTVRSVDYR